METDQRQFAQRMETDQRLFLINLQNSEDARQKTRAKNSLKYYEKQMAFFEDFCKTISHIADADRLGDVENDIELCGHQINFMMPLFGDVELRTLAVKFAEVCRSIDHSKPTSAEKRKILGHFAFNMSLRCRNIMGEAFKNADPQEFQSFKEAPLPNLSLKYEFPEPKKEMPKTAE